MLRVHVGATQREAKVVLREYRVKDYRRVGGGMRGRLRFRDGCHEQLTAIVAAKGACADWFALAAQQTPTEERPLRCMDGVVAGQRLMT